MTPEQQHFLSTLEAYLQDASGDDISVIDARPLAGGASRETWYLEVMQEGIKRRYVLRKDLPTQMFDDALTREQEFHLMDVAYKSGVSVAQVRYLCTDEAVLGQSFFIMDYVPGISIGRKVIAAPELAPAREALPHDMARELAAIHTIDPDHHRLTFLRRPQNGQSPADQQLAETYALLDELGVKNPVWEWTLRWAARHTPPTEEETFVHGDFRIGNILVGDEGLQAIIDWEFGHVGDPHEEIGYLCMRDWRFGNGTQRAAGLTDRETFIQLYEAASGRSINRATVDWWELLGNIRWGIICLSQANRHLSGEEPSVELASLGRRSAEMQLESLRLIESFEDA